MLIAATMVVVAAGCSSTRTSNTARTATEQVLLSSAIDRSLSNVSFETLRSRRVFIDDKYLDAVDKGYLIATLRHKALASGATLASSADDAELVIEARSGGVGTDSEESFVGVPAFGIPGMPITIPEVKLMQRNTQLGTAKIGLVAYDPKTGAAVGLGGQTTALTQNDDMYVLGLGPFRNGEVKQERENAIGYRGATGTLLAFTGDGKPSTVARRNPVNLVDGSTIRMADLPTSPDLTNGSTAR